METSGRHTGVQYVHLHALPWIPHRLSHHFREPLGLVLVPFNITGDAKQDVSA